MLYDAETMLRVINNAGLNLPSGRTLVHMLQRLGVEALQTSPYGQQRPDFRQRHCRGVHPRMLPPPDRERQPRRPTHSPLLAD